MVKQYLGIFFSLFLIVGQQHSMFRVTNILLKKYKDCTHFTERFLKALNENNQSVLRSTQLISQVPLEDKLMHTLLEQKKVLKANVILFVSKMVALNQAKSLTTLKNAGIDIRYLPDDCVKYSVEQDDAGNIIDAKVSDQARILLDQVALLSYNDTSLFVSSGNFCNPIIDKKKLLNSADYSTDYQMVEYFFSEAEQGFAELKADSKN